MKKGKKERRERGKGERWGREKDGEREKSSRREINERKIGEEVSDLGSKNLVLERSACINRLGDNNP